MCRLLGSGGMGSAQIHAAPGDIWPCSWAVQPSSASYLSHGNPMTKIIFMTGRTDVWGVFLARALAKAGHTVYVGEDHSDTGFGPTDVFTDDCLGQDTTGPRTVACEPAAQHSIAAAVRHIVAEAGSI